MPSNQFVPTLKNFQRVGAVLVIIAATLLVYAPAIRNGFVWDDTALVLRDPLIRSWRLIPEGFRHFLFIDATASDFYRPIQRLVFTFNYAAFAFQPAGWHIVSILIHAGAASTLYLALQRWWGESNNRWALAVAALWAIHPLHTSAVTYVAGLADPLAALFGFAGLYFALGHLQKTGNSILLAATCFLGAMLSKESGAFVLAVWLIILATHRPERRVWLQWSAVIALILAAYSALRLSAAHTPPPRIEKPSPPADRAIFAARAVSEYTGLLVAPLNLHMERDVSGHDDNEFQARWRHAQTIIGSLLIVAFAALAWRLRWKSPKAATALALAAITYIPISNVFPLNATVAEHWLYVPSAWLFAGVAAALASVHWRPVPQRIAIAALTVWALFLGIRTWQRQADWESPRTFFTRTIEDGGDSARMRLNLGNIEAEENHPDAAMAQYRVALDKGTAGDFPWLAISALQLRLKHYTEAREALARCNPTGPLKAELIQLRGAIDYTEKQIDPTAAYGEAAALSPLNWSFEKRYVAAIAHSHGPPTAISELNRFLNDQPFRADSWLVLSDLLSSANRPDRAALAKREASTRDVHLPP